MRDAHEIRMRQAVGDHGFEVRGVPQNVVLADARDREMDVHPVSLDHRGDGHLLSADGAPFVSPRRRLCVDVKHLGDRGRVPVCRGADVEPFVGVHAGETDVHDMRLLHDRLGTRLVPPYAPS